VVDQGHVLPGLVHCCVPELQSHGKPPGSAKAVYALPPRSNLPVHSLHSTPESALASSIVWHNDALV
jgi:hypothetical protein